MIGNEASSEGPCCRQDAVPLGLDDARYRRKILKAGVAAYFKKAVLEVREYHPDWHIEEVGVDQDHVHLHMIIPPKYAVSVVVATLKSVTSRRLKEKFSRTLGKG